MRNNSNNSNILTSFNIIQYHFFFFSFNFPQTYRIRETRFTLRRNRLLSPGQKEKKKNLVTRLFQRFKEAQQHVKTNLGETQRGRAPRDEGEDGREWRGRRAKVGQDVARLGAGESADVGE